MNRIQSQFTKLKHTGRKGFIPFITAGDPDLSTSLKILHTLSKGGADLIEVGVPFSDPVADGVTIQLSSQRALEKGVNLPSILELIREFRRTSETPVVLFSYFNPLLSYGINRLINDLPESGVDGLLVTDVVDDDSLEITLLLNKEGLDLISLIAPTTSDARLEKIAANASGFLYAVSRAGVTGVTVKASETAEQLVARARRFTDLPVAVGFGIGTAAQVEDVWRYADAAVVGSAIVNEIARADPGHEPEAVESFLRTIIPGFANSTTEN